MIKDSHILPLSFREKKWRGILKQEITANMWHLQYLRYNFLKKHWNWVKISNCQELRRYDTQIYLISSSFITWNHSHSFCDSSEMFPQTQEFKHLFLVGGDIWGGYRSFRRQKLDEEVCHLGWASGIRSLALLFFPPYVLCVFEMWSASLLLLACPLCCFALHHYDGFYTTWSIIQNKHSPHKGPFC